MPQSKPYREAPWAVRGVSPETKSAAGKKKKKAGLSLGNWLDRVVREAATAEIKGENKQEIGPTQDETMADLKAMMQRLTERLDQAEQKKSSEREIPQLSTFGQRARWLFTGKPVTS